MENIEPGSLPVVRPLTARLEEEPLVELVLFLECGVRQEILRVVLPDDVLDDCTSLPEQEVDIRIFDDWFSSVLVEKYDL